MKDKKTKTIHTYLVAATCIAGALMRYGVVLLAIFFPSMLQGQVHKKIVLVDGITHKPVPGIYCYILKNNDQRIGIEETDSNGVVIAPIQSKDGSATYQIDIPGDSYLPQTISIDLQSPEPMTATVFPDKAYVPQRSDLIYTGCGYTFFGDYQPREPRSLEDVPTAIRTKLEAHLINRLGQKYYSKLRLDGGQILDLRRLYIVDTNANHYQWTPYTYYLCFSFSDEAKGVGSYSARIVLDKNGNVKSEIALPDIKSHPEKASIISLEQAKAIAAKRKCYDYNTMIELRYYEKIGSLYWQFSNFARPGDTSISKDLSIDAHTGKILDY